MSVWILLLCIHYAFVGVDAYCIQFLQGESTVAKMWQNSGLEWSLFVPSIEVQTFLSNRKLGWLEKVNICYIHSVTFCFLALLQGKLTSLNENLYWIQ